MTAPRQHPAGSSGRRGIRSVNSRVFQLAAFALSFILIAVLVVTSSRAAFVAQNDNIANTVSSAAIDLTDNDADGAMFNSVGLMPGTNVEKCIDVTYAGNIDPQLVKIYATAAPTGTLATYLDLTVDVGDDTTDAFGTCTDFGLGAGGSTNVYTGTLGAFATAHPDYASGRSTTWDPTGNGQTRTFRFTLSVQDVAAAEGLTTTFGFSWETRTG
jgi:hypothetical protein